MGMGTNGIQFDICKKYIASLCSKHFISIWPHMAVNEPFRMEIAFVFIDSYIVAAGAPGAFFVFIVVAVLVCSLWYITVCGLWYIKYIQLCWTFGAHQCPDWSPIQQSLFDLLPQRKGHRSALWQGHTVCQGFTFLPSQPLARWKATRISNHQRKHIRIFSMQNNDAMLVSWKANKMFKHGLKEETTTWRGQKHCRARNPTQIRREASGRKAGQETVKYWWDQYKSSREPTHTTICCVW